MIGRLQIGDEVRFAIVNGDESTRVHGTVSERDTYEGTYMRVAIDRPDGHPNVTLETGSECGPGITVCRDYTMDELGTAPYVHVVTDTGFQAVIHAD